MNKASGWFPGGGGQFTTPPQYICPTFAGGVRLLSWGGGLNPPNPPGKSSPGVDVSMPALEPLEDILNIYRDTY